MVRGHGLEEVANRVRLQVCREIPHLDTRDNATVNARLSNTDCLRKCLLAP